MYALSLKKKRVSVYPNKWYTACIIYACVFLFSFLACLVLGQSATLNVLEEYWKIAVMCIDSPISRDQKYMFGIFRIAWQSWSMSCHILSSNFPIFILCQFCIWVGNKKHLLFAFLVPVSYNTIVFCCQVSAVRNYLYTDWKIVLNIQL